MGRHIWQSHGVSGYRDHKGQSLYQTDTTCSPDLLFIIIHHPGWSYLPSWSVSVCDELGEKRCFVENMCSFVRLIGIGET